MKNIISAASRKALAAIMAVMALAVCAPSAWAAPTTVTGVVLDSEGLEVIGGMVEVKGTKTKVVTDVNGAYAIQVDKPKKAVLLFTYLGCEPKEEQVNGRTKIDVVLKPSMQALDEVVVIGYAAVKRKELTGSVSSVKGSEMVLPLTIA